MRSATPELQIQGSGEATRGRENEHGDAVQIYPVESLRACGRLGRGLDEPEPAARASVVRVDEHHPAVLSSVSGGRRGDRDLHQADGTPRPMPWNGWGRAASRPAPNFGSVRPLLGASDPLPRASPGATRPGASEPRELVGFCRAVRRTRAAGRSPLPEGWLSSQSPRGSPDVYRSVGPPPFSRAANTAAPARRWQPPTRAEPAARTLDLAHEGDRAPPPRPA